MEYVSRNCEMLLCIGLPPNDSSLFVSTGFKITNIAQNKRCDKIWCAVRKIDANTYKIASALHIPQEQIKPARELFAKLKDLFTQSKENHSECLIAMHLLIFDPTIDLNTISPYACSTTHWQDKGLHSDAQAFNEFSDLPCIRQQLISMANALSQNANNRIIPSILFTGETGTGKSFAANLMSHVVTQKPPLTINCASLDQEHIDMTLFGTKGGMWTDVKDDVIGAFEAAGDGVLFLDEIGELPLSSQAHLLTVLQDRIVRPYGAITTRKKGVGRSDSPDIPDPIPVKCKIIFGTNKDLSEEVCAGRFRADLYYRINTLEVTFPPLTERFAGREHDEHGQYIHKQASEEKRNGLDFINKIRLRYCEELDGLRMSPGAIATFQDACTHLRWPGNFRDIHTLFTRLYILSTSENQQHIVGQHMVESAITAMKLCTNTTQPTEKELQNTSMIAETTRSFPDDVFKTACEGKNALQIYTLKFAIESASKSTSLKQAAEICYAGTTNNTNISTKYRALLRKYGLKFDPTSLGHVTTTTVNAPSVKLATSQAKIPALR